MDHSGVVSTDESEAIRLALQGDDRAWESLMRAHQESAFRLAYLFTGDPYDAEDIAQEAFIRAFQNLERFDGTRPFRPWLLSITANLARNRLRSAKRYLTAIGRLIRRDPEIRISKGRAPGPEDSPAWHAELLHKAVRSLTQQDQAILNLRYFLDLSEAETAQALGLAQGTVKSRTHRALKRLHGVVLREYPELGEEIR